MVRDKDPSPTNNHHLEPKARPSTSHGRRHRNNDQRPQARAAESYANDTAYGFMKGDGDLLGRMDPQAGGRSGRPEPTLKSAHGNMLQREQQRREQQRRQQNQQKPAQFGGGCGQRRRDKHDRRNSSTAPQPLAVARKQQDEAHSSTQRQGIFGHNGFSTSGSNNRRQSVKDEKASMEKGSEANWAASKLAAKPKPKLKHMEGYKIPRLKKQSRPSDWNRDDRKPAAAAKNQNNHVDLCADDDATVTEPEAERPLSQDSSGSNTSILSQPGAICGSPDNFEVYVGPPTNKQAQHIRFDSTSSSQDRGAHAMDAIDIESDIVASSPKPEARGFVNTVKDVKNSAIKAFSRLLGSNESTSVPKTNPEFSLRINKVKKTSPPERSSAGTKRSRDSTDGPTKVLRAQRHVKSKGKPITVGASRSLDDEEYLPDPSSRVTRSGSQKQHGIEPSRFHGTSASQSSLTKTKRRKSPRDKKKLVPETVDLLSDSDSEMSSPPKVATSLAYIEYDAVRIAIGQKVFFAECRVALDNDGRLDLSFKRTQRRKQSFRHTRSSPIKNEETTELKINLQVDLREVRYYIAGDACDAEDSDGKAKGSTDDDDDEADQMSFLALNVLPSKANGLLNLFPNKYDPIDSSSDSGKRFLLLEFRSDKEFLDLLERMKGSPPPLCAFVTDDTKLCVIEAKDCSSPFVKDNADERKMRLSSKGSPASRKKSGFLAGKQDADILVNYPFAGNEKSIEETASGLHEANGCCYDPDAMDTVTDAEDEIMTDGEAGREGEHEAETKARGRAHFLTIRVEDYVRLEPGEFLNDTLIDFWMRWISRKDRSTVHFFSSHFYTSLVEEGHSGVESWTRKKNIDVFTKKLIFIPINKSLHWSICVVVNPSAIMEHKEAMASKSWDDDDFDMKSPFPCLLFLDSLKAHQKTQVANHVRKWLNAEWKRLGKSGGGAADPEPFAKKAMLVYSPKIPYQNNSWDCGVFVCRYAFAIYLLRNCMFSYADVNFFKEDDKAVFQDLITDSTTFGFGMPDIARLREEMKTLIQRLSTVYAPWKEELDRKEKEEKAASRKAALEAKAAKATTEQAEDTTDTATSTEQAADATVDKSLNV